MEEFDGAIAGKNAKSQEEEASKHFHDEIEGVIPDYILSELAKRNPNNTSYNNTIDQMHKLNEQGFAKPRFFRDEGGKREVYDAQGEQLPRGQFGERARFEGDPATGIYDVDKAYAFSGHIRDFYKNVLGRNSIDDRGMKIISRVNYGQNFQNAFWDGYAMTFGNPGESSPFKSFIHLDVTAHEMAHGVIQHESGLVYQGQAGALNESIADVLGEVVDQYTNRVSARDADWIIGKGIWKSEVNGKGLRDMLRPGTAFNDARIGKDPQPDHMDKYVRTTKDNGGVHINSGIPNRAFAEFARAVGGYSWEGPAQIWFKALGDAGRNPSFAQFAYATVEAAKSLGYSSEVSKLERAWAAVGVRPSATATDELTPLRQPGVIILRPGANGEEAGCASGNCGHDHSGENKKDKPAA